MLSKTELTDVIRGCRRNDRYAQHRLYVSFYGFALNVCERYVSSKEAAEECMMDGFTKVFTKINQYGGEQSFEAWFKKIMINTCLDQIKSKIAAKTHSEVEFESEKHDNPQIAETLINADAEYLLYLVKQLPPSYQATFNLYAVEGYEYHEIAEMLNVNIGTVKSNLAKARIRLKEMLNKQSNRSTYAG